jgi:hypothetical protein
MYIAQHADSCFKKFRLGHMSGRRKSWILFSYIADSGNRFTKEDQSVMERMSRP